jgi:hypothetical protein
MDEAKKGLKYLRIIYTSLKNKESSSNQEVLTKQVIENILSFSDLDLHKIYDEVFDSSSYSLVSEYNRFLSFTIEQLKKEETLLKLGNLGDYFSNIYDEHLSKGIEQIEELYELVKLHRKLRDSTEPITNDNNTELVEEYDQFIMNYNVRINDLVLTGNNFIKTDQNRWKGIFSIHEFIEKLEYIYFLSEARLKELSQPSEIFKSEVMVLASHQIFTKLKLIKKISLEEFKSQFQSKNRKLTIEQTPDTKKYLARVIFKLKPFVVEDYQDEWEKRMSTYFGIKSYSKIKNKCDDDNNTYKDIETMIKSFEKLI